MRHRTGPVPTAYNTTLRRRITAPLARDMAAPRTDRQRSLAQAARPSTTGPRRLRPCWWCVRRTLRVRRIRNAPTGSIHLRSCHHEPHHRNAARTIAGLRATAPRQHDFDLPHEVKLVTPDAGATWLLSNVDPDDENHPFGLCYLGLAFPELGYVSPAALESARGLSALQVKRDRHFTA